MAVKSDVSSFLGQFDGGARPNRYQVKIVSAPKHAGAPLGELFSFLCRSSSIPASNLAPCTVAYMGREVKVPGDRTFDDWSVTVYNTKDWKIREYFEKWSSNMLKNFANITDGEGHADYENWAIVTQLDRGGNPVPKGVYDVKGIFPTSVGEISLAYDNNNTVEEFPVTFAVNYWVSGSTDNDGAGGDGGGAQGGR